jgi:phage shock protein E|tara:strand:+ start:346 stop:660 length:315 start_codon:yes stop_codon:yes gene_type:complete
LKIFYIFLIFFGINAISDEFIVIDVRTSEEFNAGHIEESSNVEWQNISSIIDKVKKDQKIYLYCRSGRRSQNATDILIDLGYEDVTNLGGIKDAAIFLDRNITE